MSFHFNDPSFAVLNVFQIIKFPNGPCNGSSSLEGTCYTSSECSNKGGSGLGTCANGFGVCCICNLFSCSSLIKIKWIIRTFFPLKTIVNKGCGETATENNTYFSSSSYSSPCTLKVCKLDDQICQLRLDFDSFVLTNPESSTTPKVTNCIDARFSANQKGNSVPVLCGTNSGKHSTIKS